VAQSRTLDVLATDDNDALAIALDAVTYDIPATRQAP
jgi:hypothetical protein